jgi:hypothetical protein
MNFFAYEINLKIFLLNVSGAVPSSSQLDMSLALSLVEPIKYLSNSIEITQKEITTTIVSVQKRVFKEP